MCGAKSPRRRRPPHYECHISRGRHSIDQTLCGQTVGNDPCPNTRANYWPMSGAGNVIMGWPANMDNWPMRINLVTPFAEKDAVKALGARWDATKKLWYITDVADLTPFLRWIPNLEAATDNSDAGGTPRTTKPRSYPPKPTKDPAPSKPVSEVPHCGCDVLPWEDCKHTAKP